MAYPDAPTEEELDRTARATEERNERLNRAAEEISRMTITADAGRGAVRATVDAAGGLLRIELDAQAARMSAVQVMPLVTESVRRAQAAIADHAREVLARDLDGDPAAQFIIDGYRQRFPVPPEPDGEPRPATRATTADEPDEDWDSSSVLRRSGWNRGNVR
jgi:DNA-binding protein YbaB